MIKSGELSEFFKMYRRPCDRDLVPLYLDHPMPVAFGTLMQSSDNNFSTHKAGATSGTVGNIHVFGQVFLHVSEHKSASLSLVWSDGGLRHLFIAIPQ